MLQVFCSVLLIAINMRRMYHRALPDAFLITYSPNPCHSVHYCYMDLSFSLVHAPDQRHLGQEQFTGTAEFGLDSRLYHQP